MIDISTYLWDHDFVPVGVPGWATPYGAVGAVTGFLCDRKITSGMRAYLAQHVGEDGEDRLIRAALDQRTFFGNARATCRVIGEVAVAPALDAFGYDAWGAQPGFRDPAECVRSMEAGECDSVSAPDPGVPWVESAGELLSSARPVRASSSRSRRAKPMPSCIGRGARVAGWPSHFWSAPA